jgi:hypothetical protein
MLHPSIQKKEKCQAKKNMPNGVFVCSCLHVIYIVSLIGRGSTAVIDRGREKREVVQFANQGQSRSLIKYYLRTIYLFRQLIANYHFSAFVFGPSSPPNKMFLHGFDHSSAAPFQPRGYRTRYTQTHTRYHVKRIPTLALCQRIIQK